MADILRARPYGSKELFRFVRLRQPRIVDLAGRARRTTGLKTLLSREPEEQRAWAEEWLGSDQAVVSVEDLPAEYLEPLGLVRLPETLPDRTAIRDPERYRELKERAGAGLRRDRDRALKSAVALKILGKHDAGTQAARLVQFLEHYPDIERVPQERRYAPAVLGNAARMSRRRPGAAGGKAPGRLTLARRTTSERRTQLGELAKTVDLLWAARSRRLRELRSDLERTRREVLSRRLAPERSGRAPARGQGRAAEVATRRARAERARAYRAAAREARNAVLDAHTAYVRELERDDLRAALAEEAAALLRTVRGLSEQEMRERLAQAKAALAHLELKSAGFCQAWDEIVRLDDDTKERKEPDVPDTCFRDTPRASFQDEVRVLGKAELVRVEETFLAYTAGEISYVETILAGELRRREVKSTRTFEELRETVVEEATDTTTEASATTTQELSSQVASELSTRFDSDVSSSVNASGGGSLGVVDLEGGALVEAGVGLGLDTSSSTESSSDFSQEIVSRAVERVRSASLERRVSRSTSLYETANLHEIDNRGGDSKNGVYCFLDKHVCITETVYGHRLFLLANLLAPGRNLLCEAEMRRQLDRAGLESRPTFDITPDDVQPGSYKELVGRFRASNVKPPPAPTVTLGRVYKTDTTSRVTEQEKFNAKKVADLLVPFFERYQRFLITDEIQLPEGYSVQDVWVTVNHGSNGISVPAHLPLSLGGAALYATPTILPSLLNPALLPVLMPYALWQIAYLASPLLHYNADSSNVTVGIGNQSQDARYFFFPPDELLQQIVDAVNGFIALGPGIQAQIEALRDQLLNGLQTNASALPGAVQTTVQDAVDALVTNIKAVFTRLIDWVNVLDGGNPADEWAELTKAIKKLGASADVGALAEVMGTFFKPVRDFIDAVLGALAEGAQSVIQDLLALFLAVFENSDVLVFDRARGLRGKLPVSFNAIALKPGVTINLNACLVRTDEALDRWRLETFSALYQAYLQQVAEYESQAGLGGEARGLRRSPGAMRAEERRAVKERVMHGLNGLHGDGGNEYGLDRLNLFENALDWKNMSWRLHRYGPTADLVAAEREGLLGGADETRRAFLTATWAQVLIPVQPLDHLEQRLLAYVDSGTADLEGELGDDALAALYQDLVLDRLGDGASSPPMHRREILPTDLIVLKTPDLEHQLPRNDSVSCPEEAGSSGAGGPAAR